MLKLFIQYSNSFLHLSKCKLFIIALILLFKSDFILLIIGVKKNRFKMYLLIIYWLLEYSEFLKVTIILFLF